MGFHIVITTFNRAGYLRRLLSSIAELAPAPDKVIVVNNASTDDTATVISDAASSSPFPLIEERLAENRGGAGGFSAGVKRALDEGAQWLWLMDDDVEVLPGAIGGLRPWLGEYSCVIGRRYDCNGQPFFWQHSFKEFLGVFLPVPGNVFKESDTFATNVGVFEGMVVSAAAVRSVGLPDPRFFITWDDAVYGWLISLERPVVYVNEFTLRKIRPQKQIDFGIRHLNDSSDLSRFYVMRNRGYVACYLRAHQKYNPVGFALGTAITALKEIVRLVAVERTVKGLGALWKGWRASRILLKDKDWRPMPPLPVG
jgi:glycosyltransferase involved in cell wall biosynthesis